MIDSKWWNCLEIEGKVSRMIDREEREDPRWRGVTTKKEFVGFIEYGEDSINASTNRWKRGNARVSRCGGERTARRRRFFISHERSKINGLQWRRYSSMILRRGRRRKLFND